MRTSFDIDDEVIETRQINGCLLVFAAAACYFGVKACNAIDAKDLKEETAIYNNLVKNTETLTKFEIKGDTIQVNNTTYVLTDKGTVGIYVDGKSAVKIVNNLASSVSYALDNWKYKRPSAVYYPGAVNFPVFENCRNYVDNLNGLFIEARTQYTEAEGDYFNEDDVTAAYRVMKVAPRTDSYRP